MCQEDVLDLHVLSIMAYVDNLDKDIGGLLLLITQIQTENCSVLHDLNNASP
jgi:hypothetical protein